MKGPLIQHTTQLIWDVSLTIPNPSLNLMHLSPVLRFSRLKRRTKKRRRQLVEISFSTANMGIFHHINWIPKEILTLKCLWHFKKITKKHITHPYLWQQHPQQKHTTRKTRNVWNPRYFCLWRCHKVQWTTSPFLTLEECQCFAYRLTTVTQASCDPSSTATGVALVELSLEGKIPKNFWSNYSDLTKQPGPPKR